MSSGTTFNLTNEPEVAIVSTSVKDVYPPDQKVDLTFRVRDSVNRLQRVQQRGIRNEDQQCVECEEKIRSLGGIDADSKTFAVCEEMLFDLCMRCRKADDINMDWCMQALISDDDSLRRYAASVLDSFSVRGKSGTEPQHADITLGYLHIVLLATQPTFENKHHCFRTKSGSNSVSNPHMLKLFERCEIFIRCGTWQSLARPGGECRPLLPRP